MTVIQIEHLSKYFRLLNRHEGLFGAVHDLFSNDYRVVKAVDDISLEINAGEIVGYIGPNGAGKSTTIKMMTGILKPTGGTLLVNGQVPYDNRQKIARYIGVVFGQRSQLWWDLPVLESFKILKEIYRVNNATYQQNLGLFNHLVDLESLYAKPVRMLSLGQRMLCDIAASFLHSPSVVFLDEPTIGLDISIKSKIREAIRELNTRQGTTIILTTHDIGDIEALCKRVVIIDKGKIIYDNEMQKLNQLFGAYRTLRVQVFPAGPETLGQFTTKLHAQFDHQVALNVSGDESNWISVTINQDQVPLRDVLNFAIAEFPVNDVKISEIATENVVRKIYEGAAL